MATKKGLLVSGKIGPHIYKAVNGIQIITSAMPAGTMKKTEAMHKHNATFGMATSLAAQVRKSLIVPLNCFEDSEMTNRLNSHMIKILGICRDVDTREFKFEQDSFQRLAGFEFNKNSNVTRLFQAIPTTVLTDNILTVNFKGFKIPNQLKFPLKSYQCKITVYLSLFRLAHGLRTITAESQTIEITKDKTAVHPFEFKFQVPNGCFYIVSLFLHYATAGPEGWRSDNSKKLNPGYICAAQISEGEDGGDDARTWIKMTKYD